MFIKDVYAAGEQPIPGVSSQLVYESARARGVDVALCPATSLLARELRPGDVVVTLGAGDVWKTGEELLTLM